MASVIKAGNATDGIAVSSDNTGILELKTGTGSGTTAVTIGTDQSVTFAGAVSSSGNQTVSGNLTVNGNTTLGDANTDTILMTAAPSIGGAGLGMGFGFRNRIINGAMVINQRATSITAGGYSVDRWLYSATQSSKLTVAQSSIAPTGFTNSLGFTSSSAYSVLSGDFFVIQQGIEGFNIADLGWGAAGAQTVTLSFWVRSSLTGTFGGNLVNGTNARSYPFSYTISVANTWEQKSITIPGDTTGTWATNNAAGMYVTFGLGVGTTYSGTAGAWGSTLYLSSTGATSVVGTNGATFYITGVQLEKGSTATSFDYRPYGTELQLCYRYYYRNKASNTSSYFGVGLAYATTNVLIYSQFPVSMRTTPSALEQTGTATDYRVMSNSGGGVNCSSAPTFNAASTEAASTIFTVASGVTAGNASFSFSNAGANAYLAWSAEL